MGNLLNTIWRAMILDDAAYDEWRERPNIFLRGIILILIVSLITGILSFAWTFVQNVQPVDETEIRESIQQSFDWQYQFNPAWQDPEMRQMMDQMTDEIIPMVLDIASIRAPLPQAFGSFFQAFGTWLSGGLGALGGWLIYGVMVLIVAHWLGGSADLRTFLGTVALYSVPGLLGLLGPIPCVGFLLALIGFVWGIIVYVKATSVATGLDGGRATVAVLGPAVILILLGLLLTILTVLWLVVLF
ncbi:MAG: YIP1 family protein [Anaerolineae bacterium]|nr:YIP1 family protein [Anaerolineae bacterium]